MGNYFQTKNNDIFAGFILNNSTLIFIKTKIKIYEKITFFNVVVLSNGLGARHRKF